MPKDFLVMAVKLKILENLLDCYSLMYSFRPTARNTTSTTEPSLQKNVTNSNPLINPCIKSARKFDALSFFGGIFLIIGIGAIVLIGVKFYKVRRTKLPNYSLM